MIDVMFKKGGEQILIRISNRSLKFMKFEKGYLFGATIDGLKFSVAGVLKEFPDLEPLENAEIIRIGKERFKAHISSMNSERDIMDYLKQDLKKHGYSAIYHQQAGHRIVKCQ